MRTLKCNAKSCVYNKSTTCVKESILVGDGDKKNNEIKCESYSPTGAALSNYEIADETFHTTHENHEQPHIDCMAEECVYNERHNCTANDVMIDTNNMTEKYGQTVCETFKKE